MAKTVFYRQNFEAGAPFYVVNTTNDFFLSYLSPYVSPLYPELCTGWASEVYPVIGVDGSYGLYSPCSGPPDYLEPYYGAVALAVMGDGRWPLSSPPGGTAALAYYLGPPTGPLPWGGGNVLCPTGAQTQVNRIEMDVQFTTRAFYEFGDPEEHGYPYVFYTGHSEGDTYGFALHVEMHYNADWDYEPGTHLWILTVPIQRAGGSLSADDIAWAAWPESRFDLDGAFHHIRFEWQYATFDFNKGNPIVNPDGWARVYIDEDLVVEALNQKVHYGMKNAEGWNTAGAGNVGLLHENPDVATQVPALVGLAARGYTNITGCAISGATITTADFYSEFARDFGSVQADLCRVGMTMREPANPAGVALFQLDFARATPGGVTQYFFGVRDDNGLPVLEFKRAGTTLVVADAVGDLGTVPGVLWENQLDRMLRLSWCFCSYVDGIPQSDGYVTVETGALSGGYFVYTTVFDLQNAPVQGRAENLPNYWSQCWICPQGTLRNPWYRSLDIEEREHPTWINRYSVLNLGYWNTAGVYDNIELSYGENQWIDIANFHDVIINYFQFKYGLARVLMDLWTSDGSPVTARLYNVTDGVSVGESVEISSTTPVETFFDVALTMGIKSYRLQVLASGEEVDYFAVGQLMKRAGA